MQIHKIFFVVFLVFGLMGMIRDNGPATSRDLFFMHVNANNDGTNDLDDLSVRVLIYDLGIILKTNSFDLNDGNKAGKFVFWDVPSNVAPGNYLARITVSNDDVRKVRHRIITVV
jgi:hypothetical protein|tara:strand:- start:365 stop:709 length:345 start_codon:yes stop_codon:yes gene_type:complete